MDPVSFLQIYCLKNEMTVEYTMTSEPRFPSMNYIFRLDLEENSTFGEAPSKKRAKQVAARNMLMEMIKLKIIDHEDDCAVIVNLDIEKENKENEQKTVEGPITTESNPVSKISELCVKKHWDVPVFEDVEEVGRPHERVFKMSCYLKKIEKITYGEGSNKKTAKRSAAQNMLDLLNNEGLIEIDEVLDRLPVPHKDVHKIEDFINLIKVCKKNQGKLHKVSLGKQIDDSFKILAQSPEIMEIIETILGSPMNKFLLEFRSLDSNRLTGIFEDIMSACNIKTITTDFNEPGAYCFSISLVNEEYFTLLTMYGKSPDPELAKIEAYQMALDSFLSELLVLQ